MSTTREPDTGYLSEPVKYLNKRDDKQAKTQLEETGWKPPSRHKVQPPPTATRRRWSVFGVAVLVAIVAALAFSLLLSEASDRVPVLTVTRAVPPGQTLAPEDIGVASVAVDDPLRPIQAARRSEFVGKAPVTSLFPGTLLTERQFGTNLGLEPGVAQVSVALKGAQLPSQRLQSGTRVRVVQTSSASSSSGETVSLAGRVLGDARVLEAGEGDRSTGVAVVSLSVDETLVPAITGAASADRVSLAIVAER